jgi:hypothetical protein
MEIVHADRTVDVQERDGLEEKLSQRDLSRRTLIKAAAAAGGGLLLSFTLPMLSRHAQAEAARKAYDGPPNAYIRILHDIMWKHVGSLVLNYLENVRGRGWFRITVTLT